MVCLRRGSRLGGNTPMVAELVKEGDQLMIAIIKLFLNTVFDSIF